MKPTARRFLRTLPVAILALAAQGLSCSAPAQEISIHTARDGDFVTVSASAVMQVHLGVAWAVLSDYDHLAKFIPDLETSRVLSRDGNRVRVEQKGDVGFFFYRQPVNVVLDVLEEPPTRITARGVEGNVRQLETRYELEPLTSGVKLEYVGRFEPDFSIPPLIGMPILGKVFARRFRSMVEEIRRRDALAQRAPEQ
ncbi:MAG TPA: SRPBCC family protein [Burkholderiales bacterium]|nr:SRPBCC family protein [Burkholderiales bacterium]